MTITKYLFSSKEFIFFDKQNKIIKLKINFEFSNKKNFN